MREPFIAAFGVPDDVACRERCRQAPHEAVVARTAVFVTDYTSVAFTFALLRRPIFYYQFDQNDFYGGSHNWRSGYFDYARDGFGPVAQSEGELIQHIERAFCVRRCGGIDVLGAHETGHAEPARAFVSQAFEMIAESGLFMAERSSRLPPMNASPSMQFGSGEFMQLWLSEQVHAWHFVRQSHETVLGVR